MHARANVAGLAGVLAGIGLIVEAALFMTSGWTPDVFIDPAAAMAFLEERGAHLRSAAFAGFANLALTVIFIAGLASALRAHAPTRAAATLYLGLVGLTAHGLVPLGLWLGTPLFVTHSASDPATAAGAWAGFHAFLEAAGGLGYLFVGLSLIAAGAAILSHERFSSALGWVAILTGVASGAGVLLADTPLDPLAGALYLPGLMLVIAFRIWGGSALWRSSPHTNQEQAA